ncbi:Transposable element Tc3 transposase [Caligus rogercresseyi]|uniref:Transposable element Tc3 transposase n=1 Tax=Caligus rogercresseyi TaxID=217165 RepID=A0A7T8JX71_CALRO|nr:Transposable element Tc3 transposase [Caligus rogercresseyi]
MRWSNEERAFAVEAYFSNRQSVVATQRAFRNRFNVAPRGPVPDRKSNVTWAIPGNCMKEVCIH